jgi:hypothetical protein
MQNPGKRKLPAPEHPTVDDYPEVVRRSGALYYTGQRDFCWQCGYTVMLYAHMENGEVYAYHRDIGNQVSCRIQ